MEAFRHTIHATEALWYYQISAKLADLPASLIPKSFNELFRQSAVLSFLRHPITIISSTGILTCCPSTYPSGTPYAPTNPQLISIAEETLVFRCAGFSPALSLLMPTFSFVNTPAYLTVHLLRSLQCSPTNHAKGVSP